MRFGERTFLGSYAKTVGVAVVVALGIRIFIIEAYRIPTSAMKPTLEAGDTIFVAKWPYGIRFPGSAGPFTSGRAPERGEVVVFNDAVDGSRDYIKRVIGLPGEAVEVRQGHVSVNGRDFPLTVDKTCGAESLPEGKSHGVCLEQPLIENYPRTTVPANSVFVLGDFRAKNPVDMEQIRSWGMIPDRVLRGKALWVWMSVEPQTGIAQHSWFPRFRFDRMLKRVN